MKKKIKNILLEVDWKKLFRTFARYYICSIIVAVIFANMYMNGWSKMLGHGNVNRTEFWNLQTIIFNIGFFGDMAVSIIAAIISPTHTHKFKYYKNINI